MTKYPSRRTFLMTSGAVAATSLMGAALSGCGGGSDQAPTVEMTTADQLALTSSKAVASIRDGSMSAETYGQDAGLVLPGICNL